MEKELETEILEEFPSFDINKADKDTIISEECFNYIFGFSNYNKINELVQQAKEKAIDLRAETSFNKKYKIYRDRYIKSLKSKNSFETNFSFDEDKNFKYNMKLKCGEWIANQTDGVYKNEFMKTGNELKMIKNYASPIPIFIAERIVNIDENIEKVRIVFYKDQKWQSIITEKNTISTKTKILQLANLGIEVNEINAKSLIEYFSELLKSNEYIPSKGLKHLGWISTDFMPYTNKYNYDGGNSFKNIFESVQPKGNYNEWKKYIKEIKGRSKTIRFLMDSSFASPLVKIFNINSFIVHLWGTSGKGKTVTQMICASIWGNPAKGKLLSTLNSTKVASERILNFLRNLPFIPDELQTIKSIYKNDFGDMIYNFTEGKGRDRGTVDSGLAENTEWDNISILSGEEPITTNVSFEGVKNRVIEIEDNSDIVEDGNEVVNFILNNYGCAGKEFIEIIQNMNKEELYGLKDKYVKELEKVTKYKKQINALSIILVADYIVSKYIFNEEPLKIEDIKEYIRNDTDEIDRYIDLIIDIANANINNFYDSSNNFPPSGQIWGKLEKTTDGKGVIMYYDFIPNKLYEILKENNINWNGIKKKMADKGYVKLSSEGKYQVSVRMPNGIQRMIKIKNINL